MRYKERRGEEEEEHLPLLWFRPVGSVINVARISTRIRRDEPHRDDAVKYGLCTLHVKSGWVGG